MREDYYSNTEADAGRAARALDESYDNDGYDPGDGDQSGPAKPRTLADDVRWELLCSGALGTWRRVDVRMTAEGVCAFPLADGDNADKITAWLARSNHQTQVLDHNGRPFMYVRRDPDYVAPARVESTDPWQAGSSVEPDPFWRQDVADKAAEHAARRTA